MNVETKITLNLSGEPETQTVSAKQGDVDSRVVLCAPTFMNAPYEPDVGTGVRILYRNARGGCAVRDGVWADGVVSVPLIPLLLAYAGTARCEVQFYSGGAVLTTGWFRVEVYPALIGDEEIRQDPAYEGLASVLEEVDNAVEACRDAGATAQAQGDYAEEQAEYARQSGDSADELAGYAREQGQAALQAAEEARTHGTQAREAAALAQAAAQRAQQAAEEIEETDVGALAAAVTAVENQLDQKVDRVEGKQLSTNDYTDADRQQVALIGEKVDKVSGKGLSTCDYTQLEKEKLAALENYEDGELRALLNQKVDRAEGKQLSTNDYTDADRQQVALIAGKVDKVAGRGLSECDYTAAEKAKLGALSNYDDSGLTARISALEGQVCAEYEIGLLNGVQGSLYLHRMGDLCLITGMLYEVGQLPDVTVAQLPADCLPQEDILRTGLWILGGESNAMEGYIMLLSGDSFNITKLNPEAGDLIIQIAYRRAG